MVSFDALGALEVDVRGPGAVGRVPEVEGVGLPLGDVAAGGRAAGPPGGGGGVNPVLHTTLSVVVVDARGPEGVRFVPEVEGVGLPLGDVAPCGVVVDHSAGAGAIVTCVLGTWEVLVVDTSDPEAVGYVRRVEGGRGRDDVAPLPGSTASVGVDEGVV
jgi:hypothetical protein